MWETIIIAKRCFLVGQNTNRLLYYCPTIFVVDYTGKSLSYFARLMQEFE